ncbi:MFS transporter [Paenibacillus tengchongensis]|uniref:MFS transporter n=1 Tax=Paenibacillus tengchongensis TaxID=2608684 RepID=UPI0016528B8C|nr:MFS transporter [Paenibacillus tengchongensis]
MATFFLIIIYLAFISLGLPDSMLGSAWPVMRLDFGAPVDRAGVLSVIVISGTIISSLLSDRVLKRFGTGPVTFVSVAVTALALLGYAYSPSIWWLAVLALPLGLGGGSIDVGLNNYVSTHYKAHHMSWLHCFWGIGAMLGPVIMSGYISSGESWRSAFLTVSLIQFGLVVLLFFTLPLWKRAEAGGVQAASEGGGAAAEPRAEPPAGGILRLKGVKLALVTFMFYSGVEATLGLWGSSFLVNAKGLSAATAAGWVSLYYGGITAGRFVAGFITFKLSNRALIRIGLLVTLAGALVLALPLPAVFSLIGFILIGLGLAPIFPSLLHETPARFGKENSQKIIGYQMAFAYTGGAILPPLLGWIAGRTTFMILPLAMLGFTVIMLLSSEKINQLINKRNQKEAV